MEIPSTALLGGVLSYLMIRTENMIYPALFHFINNSVPSLLSGLLSGGTDTAQTAAATEQLIEQGLPISFLGIYIAWHVSFLLVFILRIIYLEKSGKKRAYLSSIKCWFFLVVFTILPVIVGMILFFYGFFFESGLFPY